MTPIFDRRVAAWVAAMIPGCGRGFGGCQAIGVFRKGDLVAGVVFHNWSPEFGTIEISAASNDPKWLTRHVIRRVFDYAFIEAGCQVVVARQDPKNQRAIRIWKAIGAEEFSIPRLRGRNNAESIVTLTDDAWSRSKFKR